MCKTEKNVSISRPDSQLAISFPKFVKGREMEFEVGIPGNCGKFPYLACASSKLCEFIWKYANFDYHRVQVITLQKWKVSKLSACSQFFTLKQRLPLISKFADMSPHRKKQTNILFSFKMPNSDIYKLQSYKCCNYDGFKRD